jgi:Family of unknown function (DUF6069)
MTYPASPSGAGTTRARPDPTQFWAGAAATAVVAALIALVGILICRWTFNIPILAPSGDGAWGNAHTAEYVLMSALITIIAAGLLYLLVLAAPQPNVFFGWIMGLATLAAAVYPFSTSAPLDQKIATAAVDLVLGIAVTSLLTAVSARAIRRPAPPQSAPPQPVPQQPVPQQPYRGSPGDVPRQGYAPGQGYRPEQNYPRPGQNYPPEASGAAPTQPINVPQDPNDPRRWK